MDFQNVTQRKHKRTLNESLNISFMSSMSEYSAKSMPDITARHLYCEDSDHYKEQILSLKEQLEVAHSEIANLLTENNNLKNQALKQEQRIAQLKEICTSTPYTPKLYTSQRKPNKSLRISTQSNPKVNTSSEDLLLQSDNDEVKNRDGASSNLTNINKTKIQINAHYTQHIQNGNSTENKEHNQTIKNTNKSSKTMFCNNDKHNIFIFGDQQAYGLNKSMRKARLNKWNDNYNITSIIKPNATSSQILRSCNEDFVKTLNTNDIVVLALGCNDKYPYVLISEICNVLFSLREHTVFMTTVKYNPYLNENMINEKIELVIKNYKNCRYLKIHNDFYNNFNNNIKYPTNIHKNYVLNLCLKLNTEIDYKRYQTEILNRHKNKIINSNHHITQPKAQIKQNKKNSQTQITTYFTTIEKPKTSQSSICFRKSN